MKGKRQRQHGRDRHISSAPSYADVGAADLRQSREALNRALLVSALGELAAAANHKINQPLAAIRANAQAALRFLAEVDPDTEEIRAALTDILADSDRAARVNRQLLTTVRRPDSPKQTLVINEIIDEVMPILSGEARRNALVFTTEFTDEPVIVSGHKDQLQQVVLFLFLTSMAVMPTASGADRSLEIRAQVARPDATDVVVAISAASAEEIDSDGLFDVDLPTNLDAVSLNMSACRTIVETHGGRLWAERRSTGELSFRFTVPIERKQA